MNDPKLEKLRYPVGEFAVPAQVTEEFGGDYLANLVVASSLR